MPSAIRLGLASAATYLVAAFVSAMAVRQSSGLAVLWLPNGLVLALLLVHGRSRQLAAAIIAGAAVAGIVDNLWRSQPFSVCLFFLTANVAEVTLAAFVLRRFSVAEAAFERVRDIVVLMAACCAAPVVSGLSGAIGLRLAVGTPLLEGWLEWYVAAALSLALVTPAAVTAMQLAQGQRNRPLAIRHLGEVTAVLALVAGAAGIAFASGSTPMLFVVLPFVLLATFRLRQFGAVAAVAIVAAISAFATGRGMGPIAALATGPAGHVLFLQFFLAVTFLMSLPVAAALAERDARAEEARMIADHFKAVVENAEEVIFRTDLAGHWTYLNPAWETLSGYACATSLGRPLYAWVVNGEQDELEGWARPIFEGEVRTSRRIMRFRTAGGSVRWMELALQALCDQDGKNIGATGVLRDIDDRKRLEEHVLTAKRRAEERARAATVLASTDELTGLANRRAFLRQLDRQTDASSEFGWRLTIAMFDVDHFKGINDSHGHAVGDRVLQLVAQRAVAGIRSGDLVGRIGGEEFGILMPGASAEDAAVIAERLRQAIEAPGVDANGEALPTVTVSIGIAAQEPHQSGSALLAAADTALYAAKGAGRNRVRVAA